MSIPINKIGNFEIEHNIIKYRQPIKEFTSPEIVEIERSLKKKAKELETYPYYLNPFDIANLNSFVVLYYDVKHFYRFDVIRQLEFKEKLILFSSLIEIMKNKSAKILWDRHNFLLDLEEKEFRVILYETDTLKIHQEADPFTETKNLILMSLTTLNRVLGKPKRTDFIDQDEDIIRFAETLLKIDNEQDLEDFIETKRLEYEYKDESSESVDNKKSKTKKLKKINLVKKKKPKPVQYYSPNQEKPKNELFNKKNILLGVLLVVSFSFYIWVNMDSGETSASDDKNQSIIDIVEKDSVNVGDKEYTKEQENLLLEAYRSTLLGNHDHAIKILEHMGYTNLSDTDRKIMLNVFEANEQYAHVIVLDPSRAKDIVNTLIANDQPLKIQEIYDTLPDNIDNPYVSFEVHYLNRDFEKMLKYKDKVELNGRKEEQIFEALIGLQQYDEAEKFAKEIGNPDFLRRIPQY